MGESAVLPTLALVFVGFALGAGVGWIWGAARERIRGGAVLAEREGEARAARAACDEVRRQLEAASGRAAVLEKALAASERERAIAETRGAEVTRGLEEQRAALAAAEEKLGDAFRALAAEALAANNQGFLTLASEKLEAARRETDAAVELRQKSIESLVTPLRDSLAKVGGQIQDLERERGQAYGGLVEMVRQMASTQQRLQEETGNLARALRAPATRGRWGEVQLRRAVEMAGMIEHCDFGQQETLTCDDGGRLRPDLLVRLPGARHVAVDAKVPLEAYLGAIEATSDEDRRRLLVAHAAQVRSHVLKLGGKGYWAEIEGSPEFVVMFLPSEAIYSAALEQAPSLIEEGVARRVLIATPTTLIALLQTVHFGWRQERLADNAKAISDQGRLLHERLATLIEHWSKVGAALGRATEHYNHAAASLESRVLPAVRRLEDLGADSRKSPGELRQVDARPRALPVLDEESGERLPT